MTIVELRPGVSETGKDSQTLSPERLLEAAKSFSFTSLAIIGRETNGSLFIASTVRADNVLALLARANAYLADREDLGVLDNLDDPPDPQM